MSTKMTREEAINEIKSWDFLNEEENEALQTLIPELAESEDERIIHAIIDALYSHTNSINLLSSRGYQMEDIEAWLEKQKEQDNEEGDFTIYHPLKNGEGKYKCIPYSFYGSLTSFSEDKDLIDFLRTCFYTEEECNEWIEQQKEQEQNPLVRILEDKKAITEDIRNGIPTKTIEKERNVKFATPVDVSHIEWSKDEMHRKWILEYLYDGLRKANEQFKDQFKSAINWLENQKEEEGYDVIPVESTLEYKLGFKAGKNDAEKEINAQLIHWQEKAYDEMMKERFPNYDIKVTTNDSVSELKSSGDIYENIHNAMEPMESDDEKIRKALIEVAHDVAQERFFINRGTTLKDVLAYLENQKPLFRQIHDGIIWDSGLRTGIELGKQKEAGIQWLKSDNVKNPEKPYIDKAGMFYTTDGRMCYASEIEKQKEQKPESLIYDKDLDKAAREFYLSGGADSPVDSTGLVPIVRMAEFGATWMKERMEKEQKPVEKHDLVAQLKEYLANTPKEQVEAEWEELKKWNDVGPTVEEYFGSIMPAEWSDEDEKMLNDILGILHSTEDAALANFSEQKKWLKSFRPQPKQEWSEEDEKIRNLAIEWAETMSDQLNFVDMDPTDFRKITTWLKSLRPPLKDREMKLKILKYLSTRCSSLEFEEVEDYLNNLSPSWKPSEKSMRALYNIAYTKFFGDGDYDALRSLYEDLKKL